MKNRTLLALGCVCLTLQSCKTQEKLIEDFVDIKQDHAYFRGKTPNPNKLQLQNDYHKITDQQFNAKFLSPWMQTSPFTSTSDLKNTFKSLKKSGGFGENKIELPQSWFNAIETNINNDTYPNCKQKAITIANTSLRLLPSSQGLYSGFKNHSEGYAFDSLQNSALAANTPIFVAHLSKDKDWAYVETSFANGWIPIRDLAFTNSNFISTFKSYKNFIAITKDKTPILMSNKQFLFDGNIGMILPLIQKTETTATISVTIADENRNAVLKEAQISLKNAVTKPLPLTIKNVSDLANEMLNQPYGWGGQFGNRDCSALLKDLYAPFGIWLPRNSKAQAQNSGVFINLSKLPDAQKEAMIITNAVPYLTLLWLPGHIMLYIGEENGKAIVFHNIWGIRTTDVLARKIIGKSVITTLEPNKGVENADPKGGLLSRVEGMTLLIPRND